MIVAQIANAHVYLHRRSEKVIRVAIRLRERAERRTGLAHGWRMSVDRDAMVLVRTLREVGSEG